MPGMPLGTNTNAYYQQIEVLNNFGAMMQTDFVKECFTASQIDSINLLSKGFDFIPGSGISMLETPANYGFFGSFYTLIPVLCFVSSIATTILSSKLNGTQMQGCMMVMFIGMPLFSAYIAYSVPAAVGFYWICSTLLGLLQTVVMHRFYNPVTMIANQEARHVALMELNEKNM